MAYKITAIAFDIDGVLRATYQTLEKKYKFKIKEFDFKFKGKNFWQMLEETPALFTNSKPTKYFSIVKHFVKTPECWTFQKKQYRKDTIQWLDKYFGKGKYKVKFFNNGSEKYKYLRKKKEYILVEDSPSFKDYNRTVLVHRTYNRKIKKAYRITKISELKNIIKGVYGISNNDSRKITQSKTKKKRYFIWSRYSNRFWYS